MEYDEILVRNRREFVGLMNYLEPEGYRWQDMKLPTQFDPYEENDSVRFWDYHITENLPVIIVISYKLHVISYSFDFNDRVVDAYGEHQPMFYLEDFVPEWRCNKC